MMLLAHAPDSCRPLCIQKTCYYKERSVGENKEQVNKNKKKTKKCPKPERGEKHAKKIENWANQITTKYSICSQTFALYRLSPQQSPLALD
ncbi:hypothetical protein VTH06DRAFT_3897 [Thermothelomyces fergusii]